MNKIFTKLALVLLALTLGGQLHAQFTTTFAKNVTPGQQNGLYYSLPQTMLKLDFVIEETQLEKGPLSDYASNYFEMEDYVEYETTEYRLLDVKMSSVASPDPNALFFVTLTSARGGSKLQFDMMPNGIIRSVGVGNDAEPEEQKAAPNQEKPRCCREENDFGEGFVGLMSAGKTNAMLAKEVADKIKDNLDAEVSEGLTEIIDSVEKTKSAQFEMVFDPTLVRGMSYYTGTIFEVSMPQYGGSCGGGGRYDKMVGKFLGQDTPACGFSIGFERIIMIMMDEGFKIPGASKKVAFLIEKGIKGDRLAEIISEAQKERAEGKQVLVVRMNKNKKFQKQNLTEQGYEEFRDFYEKPLD